MNKITIKQLAEYCRDYIDLVSPSLMSRSVKRIDLSNDIFDASALLKKNPEIDYSDTISFPIDLIVDIEDLSLESEHEDEEKKEIVEKNIKIARDLDDIYRKYQTSTYTKQLSLKFGHVNFKGYSHDLNINEDNKEDNEEVEEINSSHGYLFSVPVRLRYRDTRGKRNYTIDIEDSFIKTDVSFIKNYMKTEYRDDVYRYVALKLKEQSSNIPVSEKYIDELWSKVTEYLRLSGAKDISKQPDVSNVILALEPKANYFLSQDLSGIIDATEGGTLSKTSLSAWIDYDDLYIEEPIYDNGDNELFFPFPYDKFQLGVLSKINNKGLIVEGPPGTGKSQTIANILCHLAATNKKVLFVSQKDQAVRGVKDKLKTLNIPYMFGYIPDKTSRIHTEEDERDSAAFTLRGIAQSHLENSPEVEPRSDLRNISEEVPLFNKIIEDNRDFVGLYNNWSELSKYEFEEDSLKISKEWYSDIISLREEISNLKKEHRNINKDISINEEELRDRKNKKDKIKSDLKLLNDRFSKDHDYKWLKNENEYVKTVGYNKLIEFTDQVKKAFENRIVDRKINLFMSKINDLKLSSDINKILKQLPFEMYETYKEILFAKKTKTERRLDLEKIEKYFKNKNEFLKSYSATSTEINNIKNNISTLNSKRFNIKKKLNKLEKELYNKELDKNKMIYFEDLYKKYGDIVFDKIIKRYKLGREVSSRKILNPNKVNHEIMKSRQMYDNKVKNYIKNRIAERARRYRSEKRYRSALESIAWKLNRTKKAYKTFDRLKSDSFNFEAMSAVTPVWMMGLDDASRILPLKENLFDYVIIDEASQCNISYTLPVMYRAKNALFFGDTLQMRDSTTSFKSNNQLQTLAFKHKIPEDLQIKAEGDSVKSVMDIAKLNGFETATLKNHYRSPAELIGFSNENFYAPKNRRLEVVNDDILATKDGRVLKTHLINPDPNVEISGKSNITEAYYIKKLVEKIKKDEPTKNKSIAVLSFFNEQAELLRRVITDENIKISAIEGIQGDERDIVIYSLVITDPNEKRRYIALTGESGDIKKDINAGRVNVAFSRAKLQVHVVTSLAPELWPEGVWIKKYLKYIEEHGMIKRLQKGDQKFDSKFEENVYDFLMNNIDISRYKILTQVESCGFKIDQVIVDSRTNRKLAIECDGPTHFDDGNGQVRVSSDYERQSVLETARWVFYRISYIDWYKFNKTAREDLLEAIDQYFKIRNTDANINEEQENEQDIKDKPNSIDVEVPEELINLQKENKINQDNKRNYFGRKNNKNKLNQSTLF